MSSLRWQNWALHRSPESAGWQLVVGLDDKGSLGICADCLCHLLFGDKVKGLFNKKSTLAGSKRHFLKCHGIRLHSPASVYKATPISFPSTHCRSWVLCEVKPGLHILGKVIPSPPTDGWHTCFSESWFKKQISLSLVQDFCQILYLSYRLC